MVDRFEFLRDFNKAIFQNCRKAELMVNTMNDCNLSLSMQPEQLWNYYVLKKTQTIISMIL